jgi:hypothetical protein
VMALVLPQALPDVQKKKKKKKKQWWKSKTGQFFKRFSLSFMSAWIRITSDLMKKTWEEFRHFRKFWIWIFPWKSCQCGGKESNLNRLSSHHKLDW